MTAERRAIALLNIGLMHLGALVALLWAATHGITTLDAWVTLVMFIATTAIGIEVSFHRLLSHHAFDTGPITRTVLVALGTMAAQGPPAFWVGVHRQHHAFTDRPGDPHSPRLHGEGLSGRLRGLWHAHMGWLIDGKDLQPSRYALDVMRDPVVWRVGAHYYAIIALGLVLPGVLCGLLTSTWEGFVHGVLYGGFLRVFLGQHATWAINSLGHTLGSKPFASGDESRNNWLFALPTFGGALHNNHHAFPSAASTSRSIWQLDLCGCFIALLVALRLARNPKQPSARAIRNRTRTKLSTVSTEA